MNFFGHATLAARRDGSPAFVLGAMLPDLLGMARLRLVAASPRVQAGIAHHHRVDASFHATHTFVRLQREARHELAALGLRRGPVLAIAHVGVELLLDGCLYDRGEGVAAYERALAARPTLSFARSDGIEIFDALCRRIADDDLAGSYRDPTRTAVRITRLLSRRPRLALRPEEQPALQRFLAALRPRVTAASESLLDETELKVA